jgi:hypothetical protein
MTPTREVLARGLPAPVKCCPAHAYARNRAQRRAADRSCSLAKARRRG